MISVRPLHASSARLGVVATPVIFSLMVLEASGCRPPAGDAGGTDAAETAQCFDGLDNDADALTDFPNDPGCADPLDDDETEPPECMDGRDNDSDGAIDIADVGCATMDDDDEQNPECSDGVDNDGDSRIDFGEDPDCVGVTDEREAEDADCMDLADNDADAFTDFPDDTGCTEGDDPSESDLPDCGGLLYVTDVSTTGQLSGTWDAMDTSVFAGSCGGAGPEAIAYIDVPVPLSLLSVNTFGTPFDNTLYLRTACDDGGSEIACGDFDTAAAEPPVVELTSVAPGGYFIFVDGSAAADFGDWFVHVFGIIMPGQTCDPGSTVFRCDSVTGQICSEPIAGMGFVCNAGQCSDGFDNDSDGIVDFPLDPGCTAPDDNTEPDPPVVPQCYNGADDDGDAFTDYPADPGCNATGDDLEIDDCIMGVPLDVLAPDGTGAGTTMGVSSFEGTCTASFTASGPEDVWVFELLYAADVTITTRLPGTTLDTALYVRSDCDNAATELACNDNDPAPPFTSSSTIVLPALAPGTYFVFVDGMAGAAGAYELEVTGIHDSGSPCDPSSVNFVCNAVIGDACQDPGTGTFACLPAACANGADDDGDSLVDFPDEIGCLTLADDDETDPPIDPTCSNGLDDDADTIIDYPLDPGCFYAADPTEEDNCIAGVPFTDLPPSGVYSGSLVTATGLFEGSCTTGFVASADEDVFIIDVPTASTVTFTTVDPATFVDTALYLRSTCDDTTTELACNDNAAGPGFSSASTITMALGPGTYFLFVDGMNGSTGAYQLSVSGVVMGGMPCDPASTIFTCDTAAGFACIDPGTGSFACVAGACSDTLDNDGDGDVDYPVDPGCASLADTDELDTCPGAGCPACANGADDDADLLVDYPADIGCGSASDDDEEACIWNFDDGTTMGYTVANTCTSGVGWVADSFRSVSPMYSLYYGNPATRNFDCSGLTNSGSATSTSITLPASGSEVTFWYRWDSEGCGFDELTLDVDPATGPAVQVWSRCDDPITSVGTSGGSFIEYTIDLSAYDGQTVQLIWRFDTLDGIGNSSEGHYLDDVFVNGSCP